MNFLHEPTTPTREGDGSRFNTYSLPVSIAPAQPATLASLFQNTDEDATMEGNFHGGSTDSLDEVKIEGSDLKTISRSVPANDPFDAEAGLAEFTRWCDEQEAKRKLELQSIFKGRSQDHKRTRPTLQPSSSFPHKRSTAAHHGGPATQRSRISKTHQPAQSRRGRTEHTTTSARSGGTRAKRDPAKESSVGRRRFVGSEQGVISVEIPSESGEEEESTVNELQQGMQGMSVNDQR